MTIIAYTGLPGHGKSYSVVENVIVPALKKGRVVAHNLLLNTAALSVVVGIPQDDVEKLLIQIPKNETEPESLIKLVPDGSVIVIDEIWRYWGAGLKANEVSRAQLAFFKEHRHRVGPDGKSSEIVIIDQELGSGVARFIRDLVELTYIHQKHSKLGSTRRFRVDVYSKAMEAGKASHKSGKFIRSMQGKYSSQYWNCYISHTQNTEDKLGEAGLEAIADDRGSLLKSWTFRSAIIGIIVVPFVLWWATSAANGMVHRRGVKSAQTASEPQPHAVQQPYTAQNPAIIKTVQTVPTSPTPSPIEASSSPQGDQPSTIWRIVGVVEKLGLAGSSTGDGIALLASGTGKRRLDLKQFCKRLEAEALEWSCKIDGQWVTQWTGTNLGGSMNAALVPGSATRQ